MTDESQAKRLAEQVMAAAKRCNLTLVTAESCTAGRIAALLAEAPGASQYLHGGIVAYTKDMKQRALGVSAALLQEKTAVCSEVAEAMARGALHLSHAGAALSITGVLGPEPDEDGNPVGLVFCGAADRDGAIEIARLHSRADDRGAILDEAICTALELIEKLCRRRAFSALNRRTC
jgi:nicotinamide-nucleotide amidase